MVVEVVLLFLHLFVDFFHSHGSQLRLIFFFSLCRTEEAQTCLAQCSSWANNRVGLESMGVHHLREAHESHCVHSHAISGACSRRCSKLTHLPWYKALVFCTEHRGETDYRLLGISLNMTNWLQNTSIKQPNYLTTKRRRQKDNIDIPYRHSI